MVAADPAGGALRDVSFHAFLGVIITGSTTCSRRTSTNLGLGWLPDPIPDQQRGGAIAWGSARRPALALAIMVTIQWLRQDRRETVRLDRQADRDHDAELTAYNAYLASLAERDRKGQPMKVAVIQLAYDDHEPMAERVARAGDLVRAQRGWW